MKLSSHSHYCAFCRVERKTKLNKHIGFVHIVLASVLSFIFMLFFWQEFNAIVLFLFAVNLAFAEIYMLLRWRFSVICPHCHFDPVLYLRSKEQAQLKVKQKLDRHKSSAIFLFSKKNPYLRIPKNYKPMNYSSLKEDTKLGDLKFTDEMEKKIVPNLEA